MSHSRGDDNTHPGALRDGFLLHSTERARTLPRMRGNHHRASLDLFCVDVCGVNTTEGCLHPATRSIIQARVTPLDNHPCLAPTGHSLDRLKCPVARSATPPAGWYPFPFAALDRRFHSRTFPPVIMIHHNPEVARFCSEMHEIPENDKIHQPKDPRP